MFALVSSACHERLYSQQHNIVSGILCQISHFSLLLSKHCDFGWQHRHLMTQESCLVLLLPSSLIIKPRQIAACCCEVRGYSLMNGSLSSGTIFRDNTHTGKHTFGEPLHRPPDIQDYLVVILVVFPHISTYNRRHFVSISANTSKYECQPKTHQVYVGAQTHWCSAISARLSSSVHQ